MEDEGLVWDTYMGMEGGYFVVQCICAMPESTDLLSMCVGSALAFCFLLWLSQCHPNLKNLHNNPIINCILQFN